MDAEASPWMDTKPRLFGVPRHERYPKLLDVSYQGFLNKEAHPPKKRSTKRAERRPDGKPEWYCDLSQGPNRGHWGPTPTGFLQNSIIYSLADDFVFDDSWGHRLLGFPNMSFAGLSKSGIRSLLGESQDLYCVSLIVYALFLIDTAPWWSPPELREAIPEPSHVEVHRIARPLKRRLPASFCIDVDAVDVD